MRLLVSACLLGVRCRYDGGCKPCARVLRLMEEGHTLIPVCPEQLGGLPTPRVPCERRGARVLDRTGQDRTAQYTLGAQQAVLLYEATRCEAALLKKRSPMCGCGEIYDGSFSGRLTAGDGVLAEALLRRGVRVYQEDWESLEASEPDQKNFQQNI